jgi:hypothetical protein
MVEHFLPSSSSPHFPNPRDARGSREGHRSPVKKAEIQQMQ